MPQKLLKRRERANSAHDDGCGGLCCAGEVEDEPRFSPLAVSVGEQAAEDGKQDKAGVEDKDGIGQQALAHGASGSGVWPSI